MGHSCLHRFLHDVYEEGRVRYDAQRFEVSVDAVRCPGTECALQELCELSHPVGVV